MKTLLCIIAFLSSMLCHAQTFIDDGNVWSYANICNLAVVVKDGEAIDTTIVVEENFYRYYFKGDTIINQKTYKKLWAEYSKRIIRRKSLEQDMEIIMK